MSGSLDRRRFIFLSTLAAAGTAVPREDPRRQLRAAVPGGMAGLRARRKDPLPDRGQGVLRVLSTRR
jgi:hypothetical protein